MKQKIKSRLKKDGNYIKKFKKTNYFVAWIANLGVVPLFLFVAFLLAPAFFFFLNLLFVVTHVLETIRQLLSRYRYNDSLYNNFKPYFLPTKRSCVKGIVILGTISLSVLIPTNSKAETIARSIVLARGQSTEIQLENMEKFNIGNKQVIGYRLEEKRKKLLLRGTQLGHTEILIWNKDRTIDTYQIFIVSKHQEAKFLNLADNLDHLGLESTILIPHIKASGELKNLAKYLDYKKLLDQNKEIFLDEVKLNSELKNKIYAQVYSSFFDDFKESISCKTEFSNISCFYPENEAPSEFLKKHLTEKYKINLIQQNNQQFKKNYLIKIKLIQLEQLDGEELRLGLEQVSGNLGDFLTIPIEKIIQKNQILLAQKKVRMSTLAEPQSLIRPLAPTEMQIGSEIPFKNMNSHKSERVVWKFAGLKINILLENYGDKVKINYATELTQPNSEANEVSSISGNKEKSSVIIPLGRAVKIFQLSLKTQGKSTDQMPFLSAIPLLGELFKSKSSQNNYKSITGIIEVSENDE